MKNPYDYLIGGFSFIYVDMSLYGETPDILPDFIGYAFFVYGLYLLPVVHNLKLWSEIFAFILMVMSFLVELDQWLGSMLLGQVSEQFIQFLLIVFMYCVFQLLLHVHEQKQLEIKTFETYQKFMALMLCGFVIQAFAMNVGASLRENMLFIGAMLQLMAYILFSIYCRAGSKYFKEMKKVHSLQ
ncbi:hypothetical protein [Lysinibacillus parviboronicapiens]|uniref:hypothetical protein n=1 Tax=Lysinibacillus parviboronicapiens TaxID=436516 RepID=UPI0006CFB329|nr:hypothetical protein [Lysinibacillus parviboronicapiens]